MTTKEVVVIERFGATVVAQPQISTLEVHSVGAMGPKGDPGLDAADIADAITQYFVENPIPVASEVVVSEAEPAAYDIWVQVGLGDDGKGFTVWFKEG